MPKSDEISVDVIEDGLPMTTEEEPPQPATDGVQTAGEGYTPPALAHDLEEPRLLQSLRSESGSPFSACRVIPGPTPGGHSQVLSGSSSGAIYLWPLAPGRPPRPLRLGGHRGAVTCVAASLSGGLVVSSSADASVMIWKNQAMKQSPATLRLHFSPVRAVDISGDERLLVTASDDKLLKLATVPNRRFMASLVGHSNWVRSARFSPDARLTASGGDDRTVRLWDNERHSLLRTWHDQAHAVSNVDFDPEGHTIAACSEDSVINLFDVRTKELRQHYNRAHGSSRITQVAFHPTQELLLSSSSDQSLRIWDLRAGRLQYTLSGHERAVCGCSWEHAGGRFISCDDQLVHIWSLPFAASPAAPSPSRSAAAGARTRKSVPQQGSRKPPNPRVVEAHLGEEPKDHMPLHELAPAGKPAFDPEIAPDMPKAPVVYMQQGLDGGHMAPELSEALAKTVDKMVMQMDMITRSLQSMESRLASTETAVAELSALTAARKAVPGGDTAAENNQASSAERAAVTEVAATAGA